jgi:capsular polysaccharide transport system permease protein
VPDTEASPEVSHIPPPVRKSWLRARHVLTLLSFLICVVTPSGLAAVYLWGWAEDQYASSMGFAVRREESNSPLEMFSGFTQISGSSSNDTDILFEYIKSQRLVREMDAQLDLRAIWTKPEDDFLFALADETSIEDLVDYWNQMVHVAYGGGSGSGLLDVEVRAFTPEDAHRIAVALFDRSAELINALSAIAREDAISYARVDLEDAQARLKTARENVTRFRNETQIIDPEADLKNQSGLVGRLEARQAEVLIELDLLRSTATPGDPRLTRAEQRLEVITERIAAERAKVGARNTTPDTEGRVIADIVGEYERLVVDREFAERAYLSALTAYDAALNEARRKSRYLAAYVEPTLAETAEYPHRVSLLFLFSLFLLLGWSTAVLIYYSVKDRR